MFKVSCIQVCSSDNIEENLTKIIDFTNQSISEGADFILTPEVSSIFFSEKSDLLSKITLMEDDIFVKNFIEISKKNKKWILLGSLLIKISNNLRIKLIPDRIRGTIIYKFHLRL